MVVVVVCAGTADARNHRPRAGTELDAAALGWPDSTRSASARTVTRVFERPGGKGGRVGKVARGTRVAWKRIVASRDRCRAWIEIEPRGWLCAADVAPSADEPAATLEPARIVEETTAQELYSVAPGGARAYRSAGAIERRERGEKLNAWKLVRGRGTTVTVRGAVYVRTDRGYIASARLKPRPPSSFSGRDLIAEPPPAWPFAWVTPPKKDARTSVRAAPDDGAAELRTLGRREVVAVLETRGGFARIAEGEWVTLDELRVARRSKRPRGVDAGERWLDADLDEQVLIAYEGDTPVFATLLSSGRGRSTPTGIHRITKKIARARMKAPKESYGTWDMPDVPFAMRFRKHYAVHGVYWHDGFGDRRSQGCLNLSPQDARVVFEWTRPAVPAGWFDARDEERGTPIRIRNRKDPDPGWVDFDAPPPPSVRLRDVVDSEG